MIVRESLAGITFKSGIAYQGYWVKCTKTFRRVLRYIPTILKLTISEVQEMLTAEGVDFNKKLEYK